MKFVRMTFSYFTLEKFIKLALVALLPAIALSSISSLSSISDFLVNYFNMDLSSFSSIFESVSELRVNRIPIYIVVVVIFIIGLSEMFGTVERDMRVGDFNLKGFFRRINNNGLAVGITVLFLLGSIFFMGAICAAFFFLWSFISYEVLAHILSMLTALILFALVMVSWVNFFTVVPIMIITGQSLLISIRDSIRHTQGIFMQLVKSILFPLLPAFLIIYASKALNINRMGMMILDIIIHNLLIVYYVVMMLVVHYEITGLTREDLNPKSRFFR